MDESWITHRMGVEIGGAAGDPDPLLLREWTLTNGTGAYAMGTAAGCNTRRYHGLLVAAVQPPAGRLLALSQMGEQVILSPAGLPGVAEQTLEFTTHVFRNLHNDGRTFAPRGFAMLTRFERGLSVRWVYRWGAIGFERELILHWKEQAATLRYRVTGLDDANLHARLRLEPLVSLRYFHALRRQHELGGRGFELDEHRREYFTVADPDHPAAAVTFLSSHGDFVPRPDWWRNVFYPGDTERGQEDTEDLFVPCRLETPVGDATVVEVTAALGRDPVDPMGDTLDRAAHLAPIVERLKGHSAIAVPGEDSPDRLARVLAIAADDFVADRGVEGEPLASLLAGYPWFAEWGRDTFIALPGLLLHTGRFKEARTILRAYADAIHDGLVPNFFDERGVAHNDAVDASLWYLHAAFAYVRASSDHAAWREWLAAACLRIIDAYIVGTAHGIVMDTDGLITAGDAGTRLTWMAARVGDRPVTPRHGKAVEINALWHCVLCGMAELLADPEASGDLAARFADAGGSCRKLADRVGKSFTRAFWNGKAGCLFDRLVEDRGTWYGDPAIRPNQVLAVSLPHSPLPAPRQRQVLRVVKERLLTPVGLRSLIPTHPDHRGRYTGDAWSREEACHQGTIWPWFLGPYAEAVLRVGKFTRRAREEAAEAIAPLVGLLLSDAPPASLGQLPEMFEAEPILPPDSPTGGHRPVGAIAQGCGIAELLRARHLIAAR